MDLETFLLSSISYSSVKALSVLMGCLPTKSNQLPKCCISAAEGRYEAIEPGTKPCEAVLHSMVGHFQKGEGSLPTVRDRKLWYDLLSPVTQLTNSVPDLELRLPLVTLRKVGK